MDDLKQVSVGDILWQAGGETHGYANTEDIEMIIVESLW